MSQNPITLALDNAQLTAIDGALDTLEQQMQFLIALTVETRRFANKMGAKSEAFCRQTLSAMKLYPHMVPSSVDVHDADADLIGRDADIHALGNLLLTDAAIS